MSWLVPIFRVSRPSGVCGHASGVMTGYGRVNTALQWCAVASRTRLQPISQPNLPFFEAQLMRSQRHIRSGRPQTRADMAQAAAVAGAGARVVRRARWTAEEGGAAAACAIATSAGTGAFHSRVECACACVRGASMVPGEGPHGPGPPRRSSPSALRPQRVSGVHAASRCCRRRGTCTSTKFLDNVRDHISGPV